MASYRLSGQDKTLLDRYQKLIDISRDLASTLNLDLLLNRIVDAAADLTASEAASILLYDADRAQLYFQAASNLDRPFMRGLAVPVENSIAGWIVQNRKPVIADDPQSDSRFFAGIQKQAKVPTHSLLGVPLFVKDQVIGVLEAINKTGGVFTEEDQEILLTLGTQAAVAIENARLFAQSDLIAEMVHELRTPLTSLNASANLLLRPDLPQDQRLKIISIIQSESQRLAKLTTDFLDLARLESGRMKFEAHPIEPAALLAECVGIARSSMDERKIKLVWLVPKDLPPITGDPDKLKQVFLNLLNNAVKYNLPEGSITIAAESSEQELIVRVSDTGLGIPEDSLKHLFEKFYRVPSTESLAQGIGLGLSIVKRILDAHSGSVRVESAPGAGSTFEVHLPLHI